LVPAISKVPPLMVSGAVIEPMVPLAEPKFSVPAVRTVPPL
jgi:hypothetical protein